MIIASPDITQKSSFFGIATHHDKKYSDTAYIKVIIKNWKIKKSISLILNTGILYESQTTIL